MKNKVSSLIAEGILFCGSGILLLSYSLISYAKAFNKSWSQSPYLFPALVGAALIGLSIWIMGQGVLAMKRAGNGITLKEKTDSKGKDGKSFGSAGALWTLLSGSGSGFNSAGYDRNLEF